MESNSGINNDTGTAYIPKGDHSDLNISTSSGNKLFPFKTMGTLSTSFSTIFTWEITSAFLFASLYNKILQK